MKKAVIRSERLPEPDGPFSHGVQVGNMLFLAGQAAVDAEGQVVAAGDIRGQTVQTLENLRAVLESAGATLDNVVAMTVYLTNISDRGAVAEIRERYFTSPYPASTLVEVSRLAFDDLVIEIEAIAIIEAAGSSHWRTEDLEAYWYI